MSAPGVGRHELRSDDGRRLIERLLFIADAAVADVDELPPTARAMIDAAADVYVVTPTLPGRLAWLADDVDRFRSVADERLDAVLSHLRSIGIDARGVAARGSLALVIADAVAEFAPDHILIALRRPERANWQEHRLIERIEQRFRLPVTVYAVDGRGSTRTGEGPLLLCCDGSGDDDRTGAELGARVADEGARLARAAGLEAEPMAAEGGGPVWATILEIAERVDAATIVMGPRGLRARWPMLMGSVSSAVVHHTDRPTLLIPQPREHALRR
jgi:nucleotide-binding universal stress UspA family protein